MKSSMSNLLTSLMLVSFLAQLVNCEEGLMTIKCNDEGGGTDHEHPSVEDLNLNLNPDRRGRIRPFFKRHRWPLMRAPATYDLRPSAAEPLSMMTLPSMPAKEIKPQGMMGGQLTLMGSEPGYESILGLLKNKMNSKTQSLKAFLLAPNSLQLQMSKSKFPHPLILDGRPNKPPKKSHRHRLWKYLKGHKGHLELLSSSPPLSPHPHFHRPQPQLHQHHFGHHQQQQQQQPQHPHHVQGFQGPNEQKLQLYFSSMNDNVPMLSYYIPSEEFKSSPDSSSEHHHYQQEGTRTSETRSPKNLGSESIMAEYFADPYSSSNPYVSQLRPYPAGWVPNGEGQHWAPGGTRSALFAPDTRLIKFTLDDVVTTPPSDHNNQPQSTTISPSTSTTAKPL